MTNFSITSAAVELGVSKETVRRRLAEIGVKTGKGETFTLRELFKAMSGDPRLELTRLRRAQADAEERKNRIAEGELIAIEEATQIYRPGNCRQSASGSTRNRLCWTRGLPPKATRQSAVRFSRNTTKQRRIRRVKQGYENRPTENRNVPLVSVKV